jgi:hypothetical protein
MERKDEERNGGCSREGSGGSFEPRLRNAERNDWSIPEKSGAMNTCETDPERRKIVEYLAAVTFTGKNAYV